MRALCVDIDGVLHSVDDVSVQNGVIVGDRLFRWVPLLAAALEGHEVQIIISSAWAGQVAMPDLLRLLGPLAPRVIGTTNKHCSRGRSRYRECELMAAELKLSDWVILDDQVSIVFGNDRPTREQQARVIWCDPIMGLKTSGVLRQLSDWLESTQ